MSDQNTFTEFIRRIRAGDEQAAEELVRRYEPLIRRTVRLKLEDPSLYRLFDSMDVCQSVLASFFVRTAAGQYDLKRPEQLINLLVTMTRNKLVTAARRQHRQRRDHRRAAAGGMDKLAEVAATGPSPSEQVEYQELLSRFREGLSDEERAIADLRNQGLTWSEVAARLGGEPQARRIQFARAVERVTRELGLDDDHRE
jgi:RNA polymerase sigma-70 factor (ECF subfamily)